MKAVSGLVLLPLLAAASDCSVERTTVDGIEVVRLLNPRERVEVSVVPSIGNIAFEMKVKGKNVFWFPFASLAEFRKRPVLAGNPFLAPWANRLDQDAFHANGKKYALNPALGNLRRDPNKNPIHGLLLFSPHWKVVSVLAGGRCAEYVARLEFWRHPDLMAQFPFAHTIEMIHRLKDGVLEVETVIENHAAEPMPVAVGFHPYFRLHDSPREDWKVHVAARERPLLSPLLVPTGAVEPVALPDPAPLAGSEIDDLFTSLVRDASGKAEFWVKGKNEQISVVCGPRYPVAIVYAPKGRDFICFEPMAAVTNAFNLAHEGKYKELQTIPPGGTWRESFWVRTAGF